MFGQPSAKILYFDLQLYKAFHHYLEWSKVFISLLYRFLMLELERKFLLLGEILTLINLLELRSHRSPVTSKKSRKIWKKYIHVYTTTVCWENTEKHSSWISIITLNITTLTPSKIRKVVPLPCVFSINSTYKNPADFIYRMKVQKLWRPKWVIICHT